MGVVPHCDNNPQRARTRPLDAASKERGAQQQRATTNAAGSAPRGRHPEFIENRKLNSHRLEGRGHPPPRGGARVSLVDPRPNRRANHRSSITEQRKNFPCIAQQQSESESDPSIIEQRAAKKIPQHRPASKSPSSCSASHLKSRPKSRRSLYVSPRALPQHFCLPPELIADHCIAKIFTMRLQIGVRNGAILIQQLYCTTVTESSFENQ